MATRHYVPRAWPFSFTNGIQASYLEVDVDTGFVRLLKHCVITSYSIHYTKLYDVELIVGKYDGAPAATDGAPAPDAGPAPDAPPAAADATAGDSGAGDAGPCATADDGTACDDGDKCTQLDVV